MASQPRQPAGFWTQADALMRKNLTFQKRNRKANCRLMAFPVLICLVPFVLQQIGDIIMHLQGEADEPATPPAAQTCTVYGMDSRDEVCSVTSPPENPPLLNIPGLQYRAVRSASLPFGDLPKGSCRKTQSCPVTMLVTGNNKSLAQSLGGRFFPSYSITNASDVLFGLAEGTFGSSINPEGTMFIEPTFKEVDVKGKPVPVYNLQSRCRQIPSVSVPIPVGSDPVLTEVKCLKGISLFRNNASEINRELYKGYRNGNPNGEINEFVAAYDFLNSSTENFNVCVWYNSTMDEPKMPGFTPPLFIMRIARAINLATNTYLELVRGPKFKILLEFVKEMPKHAFPIPEAGLYSLYGALIFTWVVLQLYPVIVTSVVYEKQEKLRMMMKMHGLSDGPYWMISYIYFLAISSCYMLCFVASCILLGPDFFLPHEASLQFVFYFVYLNLQIAFSLLFSGFFSTVRTSSVVAYLMVFGTGLVGKFYFEEKIADPSFPRGWITAMEIYPGFSLYRMLYEFSRYGDRAKLAQITGMTWKDLSDGRNGMKHLLILMVVQWFVLLVAAYYVDQVSPTGSGVRRSLLFFIKGSSPNRANTQRDEQRVLDPVGGEDIAREREKVDQSLVDPNTGYTIICDNLKKEYPGIDGNPPKQAVRGLSLALPRGECFGMLGPNGAGKTSFIKMMTGLTEPSSGTAYIDGLDLRTDMDRIYTSMGVCPQHDLLWETLTAREHLLFYGRLKNLKDSALTEAVEESLRGVNLLSGGTADKEAGKYSGGMKRRLSVAISLIGDPKVVYMDEPSTGLDPASRSELWEVVLRAKANRVIILTTHAMDEAERLCDRLGIFVDGKMQCIGNAKQLKARYGGSYVFTMTTAIAHENEVEALVRELSPGARKIYHISGTQKFEIPREEITISGAYAAVEDAKTRFAVQTWGMVDCTLEDVFIKVAGDAEAFNDI